MRRLGRSRLAQRRRSRQRLAGLLLTATLIAPGVRAAGTSDELRMPDAPILATPRTPFEPARDAFAFANGLRWDYATGFVSVGQIPARTRNGYDQRCPQMARAARQFFYAARFEPGRPRLTRSEYTERIARVLRSDPRRTQASAQPVRFPGFAGLRDFSSEYEDLLKEALGGRWRAYFQRGNWRMIFAFPPSHQRRTAREILDDLKRGHPPILHLVRYHRVTINHTLLVFAATSTTTEIRFATYDPNHPQRDVALRYDRVTARFELEPTFYWPGGEVSAYEVLDGWLY
jgi:hypothetical protein